MQEDPNLAARQREVDDNYRAFLDLLPELLGSDPGSFVLMRQRKTVQVFDTLGDAVAAGHLKFDDGLFSVQEVTEQVADLGFFSHAVRDQVL